MLRVTPKLSVYAILASKIFTRDVYTDTLPLKNKEKKKKITQERYDISKDSRRRKNETCSLGVPVQPQRILLPMFFFLNRGVKNISFGYQFSGAHRVYRNRVFKISVLQKSYLHLTTRSKHVVKVRWALWYLP